MPVRVRQGEVSGLNLGAEIDSKGFFELLLQNAREGYLSDPIYGGNRGMARWKMIGFPAARYDYRPYVDRRGENLNLMTWMAKESTGWLLPWRTIRSCSAMTPPT